MRARSSLVLLALALLGAAGLDCGSHSRDHDAPPRIRAAAAQPSTGVPAAKQSAAGGGPGASSPSAAAAPAIDAHARAALVFPGTTLDHDVIIERLRTEDTRTYRPVGSTAVVFKLTLAGGINAAFKPASRQHPRGHLAEISAYRIARCLALDDVPPVVFRTVGRRDIRSKLNPEFATAWDEIDAWSMWDGHGGLPGAFIYWVEDLRLAPLDGTPELRDWQRWIRLDSPMPPPERTAFARDMSNMLAFDYLVGNWDRFSGGNVNADHDLGRVIVRDHNIAFSVPFAGSTHERVFRRVARVQRWSRRFVTELRALDAGEIRAELARDPGLVDQEALTERQLEGVLDRRQTLLTQIEALIESYGPDRVLAFE